MDHVKDIPVIQAIKAHPNRDLILIGLGGAALIGVYACYNCCSRNSTKAAKVATANASYTETAAKSLSRMSQHILKLVPSAPGTQEEEVMVAAEEAHAEEVTKEVKSDHGLSGCKQDKPSTGPCAPCDCEKYLASICGSAGQNNICGSSGQKDSKKTPTTSSTAVKEGDKEAKTSPSTEHPAPEGDGAAPETASAPETHPPEGDNKDAKSTAYSEKSAPEVSTVAPETIPAPAPEKSASKSAQEGEGKSEHASKSHSKTAADGDSKAPSKSGSLHKTASKDKKPPPVDGNKYLHRIVHPPPGMICPPARVGISMFMDTRRRVNDPPVCSNVKSYQRDRWFRGNTYSLPAVSAAYIRASQGPVRKHATRPGKMLKVNGRPC